FGIEVQLITPDAAKEKWPLLRTDDLVGAAWLPHDGKAIPKELCIAMAKGARKRGATVLENIRVTDVEHKNARVTGVKTNAGNIRAEYVVLCGGMWTRELGLRC